MFCFLHFLYFIFFKRRTVQPIVTIHSALITVPTPVPALVAPLTTAQIFAWKDVSVMKVGSQMVMRVCLWETVDVSIMANT